MKTKKVAKNEAQQGDVLLKKLSSFPEGKKVRLSKAKMVLAEGESTGHCHVIEEEESELWQIGDKMILDLQEEATVTHQEHKPITLAPGIWEVGKVQEFDYFSKMKRPVQD